tara:strand:+ start:5516 stop:6166 length:651 start_codon:yes stop_codon:yes gene_type:complete
MRPYMSMWDGYKEAVFNTFPDMVFLNNHTTWQNKKGVNLTADLYAGKYFLKSRHVDIWDGKNLNIHNNIIYPKTPKIGDTIIPCFGMDLMGFSEKKCIIVFDFQHPIENYLLDVPPLPKTEETYRFFEKGNHFSNNIFVRYCEADGVDTFLPTFKYYLSLYKEMIDKGQPTGEDTSFYHDFDKYMIRLDPISGYLGSAFGKEESEKLIKEFFFSYA